MSRGAQPSPPPQMITTERNPMSYQAYLDALEWLQESYGVGRGHAMALYGVIKNGPVAPEKHVGSTGAHRDESATLRLDGLAARE